MVEILIDSLINKMGNFLLAVGDIINHKYIVVEWIR